MTVKRYNVEILGWEPRYEFPIQTIKGTRWVAGGGAWENVYTGQILATSAEGAMNLSIALYHTENYHVVTVEVKGDTRVAVSDWSQGPAVIYQRGENSE